MGYKVLIVFAESREVVSQRILFRGKELDNLCNNSTYTYKFGFISMRTENPGNSLGQDSHRQEIQHRKCQFNSIIIL